MQGECEESEGGEEAAVNCAPCTMTSDLTGLPVDGLMDVGEGMRHGRNFFVHISNDMFLPEMSLLHQRLMQMTTTPSLPAILQDHNTTMSPSSNGRLTSFDVGVGNFHFILLQTQPHTLLSAAGIGNKDG